MTTLNFEVDSDIYNRFKAYCALNNKSIKARLIEHITRDADKVKNGKD